MKLIIRILKNDSAQVLPIFAMLTMVLLGLMGLAADIGRVYVARAQLGRSVDAAALAGAKQLPNLIAADAKARAYIAANDPDATIQISVYPDVAAQQVAVSATKKVDTIFLRALGVGSVNIKNDATAGFGVVPVDAVMAIDATGSMGANPPCVTQTTSGCPIYEAKNAAAAFTNTLLPGNNTVVGNISFRGCIDPPDPAGACVLTSGYGALTNSASTLITKINGMTAPGGSGTNVCLGLDQAASVLFGPGSHSASNTIRTIVILSDGDNTYNNVSYVNGQAPPLACRPANSSSSDIYLSTGCSSVGGGATTSSSAGSTSDTHEKALDILTKSRADAIKALGVEIYVVGLGVCGTDDGLLPTAGYCANIGNTSPDTVADQRLLKCVASSSGGTNDHFFPATTATQLPAIFQQIAQNIAFRLIK